MQPFSQHKAPRAPKRQDASFVSEADHGHAEPHLASPPFAYMEKGTQTEAAYRGRDNPPASQDEAGEDEEEDDGLVVPTHRDEDDCAITTSSEYSDEDDFAITTSSEHPDEQSLIFNTIDRPDYSSYHCPTQCL